LSPPQKPKTRSLKWRFTALRGHAVSAGWLLFFASLLVIVIFGSSNLCPAPHPSTRRGRLEEVQPPLPPGFSNHAAGCSSYQAHSNPARVCRPAPHFSQRPLDGGLQFANWRVWRSRKPENSARSLLPKEKLTFTRPAGRRQHPAGLFPSASPLQTRLSPGLPEIWLARASEDSLGDLKPVYAPGSSTGGQFQRGPAN